MRNLIIFLIIFLSSALPATAMEVLLGRIAFVNNDTGEIILNITPLNGESLKGEEKDVNLKLILRKDKLPAGIHKGSLVRVWGNYSDSKSLKYFDASQIVSVDKKPSGDPTGVRQRLRHGRGMKGKRHGGR